MERGEWVNATDKLMNKVYGHSIFDFLSLDYMYDMSWMGMTPQEAVDDVGAMNGLKRREPVKVVDNTRTSAGART
jgi:hypothetical protein